MSRLVEILHKLHRSPAPLGFGLAQAAPAPKRMLVIARVEGSLDAAVAAGVSKSADAVALVRSPDGAAPSPDASGVAGTVPVGLWLEVDAAMPEESGEPRWDFIVCGADGPVDLLALKDSVCLVRVIAGMEGSRLRAIADLGADAVVLSPDGLELDRISAAIECRRVRLMSGRPVLLHIASPLTPRQVAVLWRAGVDAVVVDVSGDCDALAAARGAVESAPCDTRGESRGSASIGVHLARPVEAPVEEKEDDEGEEEEEPDDDE